MPRLFVALDPPPSWHTPLQRLATNTLDARWTPPEQYHVTLHFIGEVSSSKADEVAEALGGVREDVFKMKAQGLLTFPSRRKPRIIAVGIEKTPTLERLHADVERILAAVGIPPEDRSYHPHVTVARLKRPDPRRVHAFVKQYTHLRLDPTPIDAFHLYESQLHPEGALHLRRHTFALAGPTDFEA